MKLTWKRGDAKAHLYNDAGVEVWSAPVFNEVRTRPFDKPENERKLHLKKEVVTTQPTNGKPVAYMPHHFPAGNWKITGIFAHDESDTYLHPFFIATTAGCSVEKWELDATGGYDHGTGVMVNDSGYGLHSSSSRTTLGCIRIGKVNDSSDLEALVNIIRPVIDANKDVDLIITE